MRLVLAGPWPGRDGAPISRSFIAVWGKMIHFEGNIYSISRLVPGIATVYVADVDLVCRTLFLARAALSAIFLSKSGRFNFRTWRAEMWFL